ncbi:2-amino-4-hydroxy-6-hydroxymethyldihydropteridine diphosphokinase [Shewanella sp. D64]|uniref:2-amino-4-hydroxy-6- hydroxymethyldihydropteridine diphosphokinase n=1 Tax=unclassified Shewanella TaxID=196818 RepID=UPI0022BA2E04|nr:MULTISPECIES: 2-amino-4-hydroxy-6-hydroxymethyldihydropteridine diphosphokinase [unclassified Shewanella]MEC4724433.1 2-amino-4-hydroxy-6-hydroxymethyldihydropteridine diphosphokinase [Shewanella sp. D64]MEC4736790.1 2-amino-4-hydroxy-6-hydroxymethyldihydropteridine diphosphokinase [Shewanella sp. E94]WBJ94548.1 2-amino-4-hydroxy-6-hydroxymethyldihydropteridine diphosphokinase [Shewanella sp. MTB7]
MTKVFVALGANLTDPVSQLDNACLALAELAEVNPVNGLTSLNVSPYYRSAPMGEVEQPDYVNAVASFDTALSPIALLDALQKIENEQGRVRLERWGPRTLDLDILLYGKQIIDSPRLIIPHYGMKQRSFVLLPLADIAPRITLPCGTPLNQLINVELAAQIEQIVR